MKRPRKTTQVVVLDANGNKLASTSEQKARRLLKTARAALIDDDPLTIQLPYVVDLPPQPKKEPQALPGQGKRILLHICCAPCATYTVKRLRELAFDVVGYWYNPNIHPFSEHERRRETLAQYAGEIALPVIWEPGYEIVNFMRAIHLRERFGLRCRICYRMRLTRAAQVAADEGFDAMTTTLLISPYQNQKVIAATGAQAAAECDTTFFDENFRRGWREHAVMTREHHLYSQRYCGCVYSEWEARDRKAVTRVERS